MVGAVVVAAVGQQYRQAVGSVPGSYQVVGAGFAGAVGAAGGVGGLFGEHWEGKVCPLSPGPSPAGGEGKEGCSPTRGEGDDSPGSNESFGCGRSP